MSDFVNAAKVSELPEGEKTVVDIDGRAVALFHVGGQFYAIDDVCTHDGGPLAEGALQGHEIECPRHGARFDIRSGKPLCMPAFEPVAVHDVKVVGDDVLVKVNE